MLALARLQSVGRGALLFLAAGLIAAAAVAGPAAGYHWHVRTLSAAQIEVAHPAGLAFVPATDELVLLSERPSSARAGDARWIAAVDRLGELSHADDFLPALSDPINITFDPRSDRFLAYDAGTGALTAMRVNSEGLPEASTAERFATLPWRALDARGITVDPGTGTLFILEGSSRGVLRVEPPRRGRSRAADLAAGRASRLPIEGTGATDLRGIAFDPAAGHLQVLGVSGPTLFELDLAGRVVATRDLGDVRLVDPQGLVFAPSGDQTDDPSRLSLFIADAGARGGAVGTSSVGAIVEISLLEPAAPELAPLAGTSTLANTIDTAKFSPPSPDPSGLAYLATSNHLLVCDGEVDEMPIYAGANVWEATLPGAVYDKSNTLKFSKEPTDVAVNPRNGHWFFSDDDKRTIFEIALGADGKLGTSDDMMTSFGTNAFGSGDPEGLTYDTTRGHLFIADGVNAEIYHVNPGANGRFDGVPPTGDDQVSHFDTAVFGLNDPEGVDYNGDADTLFIVGRGVRKVVETTIAGSLVREIDLSFLTQLSKAAAVAYAPASNNPAVKDLYIADRAVDNNSNPNENDGKIFEVTIPDSGPPPPPPPPSNTVEVRIALGSDDAEESAAGAVDLTSSDIELVDDATNQTVGLRFPGVNIARSSAIAAAWIQFKVDEITTAATALTLRGEAADSAATFTTAARNVSSRPPTTASVAWTPAAWGTVGEIGPSQRTPDMTSIVQEIVNRPGWNSGNALAVIVIGSGRRTAEAFEGDAAGAALLHVEIASATCGDGVREGSEGCDGSDFGGATCADRNCGGGTPTCTASCVVDYSTCTGCATCGNGIREGTEACDGSDLGGETCRTQGFGSGTLACKADCTGFDTSGCSVCDLDGVCDAGEDCNSCQGECMGSGPRCGNDVCETADGEDCRSCPSDCNGVQNGKTTRRYCCGDGDGTNPVRCSDSRCTANGNVCASIATPQYCCGNGTCESGETSGTCAVDCGP